VELVAGKMVKGPGVFSEIGKKARGTHASLSILVLSQFNSWLTELFS
jgi:hypothetical protein